MPRKTYRELRKKGIEEEKKEKKKEQQHQKLTAERMKYNISYKILHSIIYIRVTQLIQHILDSYKHLSNSYNSSITDTDTTYTQRNHHISTR